MPQFWESDPIVSPAAPSRSPGTSAAPAASAPSISVTPSSRLSTAGDEWWKNDPVAGVAQETPQVAALRDRTWDDAKYYERRYNAETDPQRKQEAYGKLSAAIEEHAALGGTGSGGGRGEVEATRMGARIRESARSQGVKFLHVPAEEVPGAEQIIARQEAWLADPQNAGQEPPESLFQVQRGERPGRVYVSPSVAQALLENYQTRTDPNRAYQAPGFVNDLFTGNVAEREAALSQVAPEIGRNMPVTIADALGGGPNMGNQLLSQTPIGTDFSAVEGGTRAFIRGSNVLAANVIGGGTSMAGTGLEMIAPDRSDADAIGRSLQDTGQRWRGSFEGVAQSVRGSAGSQGLQPANWRWWTENLAEQTPAFVAMLVPGMGAGRIAEVAKASEQAARWMMRGAAFSSAATIEATGAYNDTFDRIRAAGGSDEDAHTMALIEGATVGAINGALEQVPLSELLLKNKKAMGMLQKAVRGSFAEGSTEAIQEYVPMVVAELAEQGTISFADSRQFEQILTSALIGGVMGGAANVALDGRGGSPGIEQTQAQPFTVAQPPTATPGTAQPQPAAPPAAQPATPTAPEKVEVEPGLAGTLEPVTPEQSGEAEKLLAGVLAGKPAQSVPGPQEAPEPSATPESTGTAPAVKPGTPPKGFSGPVFPRRDAAIEGAREIAAAATMPMYLVRHPDGWGYDMRAPEEGSFEIVRPDGQVVPGTPKEPDQQPSFRPDRRAIPQGHKYRQSDPQYQRQKKRLRAYQFEPGAIVHGTTAQDIERIALEGIRPSSLSGRVDAEQIGDGRQSVGTATAYAGKGGTGDPVFVQINSSVDKADSDGGAGAVDVSSRGRDRVLPKDIDAVIFGDGAEFSRAQDGPQFLAKAIDHARSMTPETPQGTTAAKQPTERKPNERDREERAPGATPEETRPAGPAGPDRSPVATAGVGEPGQAPVAPVSPAQGPGTAAEAAAGGEPVGAPAPAGGGVGQGGGEGRPRERARAAGGDERGGPDDVRQGTAPDTAARTRAGPGAGGTAGGLPVGQPGAGGAGPAVGQQALPGLEAVAGEQEMLDRRRAATLALTDKQRRTSELADDIAAKVKAGEKIRNVIDLNRLATRHYGGSSSSGAYATNDAYQAMELALNRLVDGDADIGGWIASGDAEDLRRALNRIDGWMELVPTQTVRSVEKDAMQQFSTPPTYAALAAWVAAATGADTVLEPSAGTGSMIAPLSRQVAAVQINELDRNRVALASTLPGVRQSFTENAEQIANILPRKGGFETPTLVVMNPPFSQTAGRLGDKKDLHVAENHVEQALKLLAPGGRLVAIVGRGMTMDSKTHGAWWGRVSKEYDVRANVGISGAVYARYGTAFGTRLLVIDKQTPSGATLTFEVDAKGAVVTLREAAERLKDIRNGRTPAIQPSGRGEPQVHGEAGSGRTVAGPAGGRGAGRVPAGQPVGQAVPAAPGVPDGNQAGPAASPVQGAGAPGAVQPRTGEPVGGRTGEPVAGESVGSGAVVAGERVAPVDERLTEQGEILDALVREMEGNPLFSTSRTIDGGRPRQPNKSLNTVESLLSTDKIELIGGRRRRVTRLRNMLADRPAGGDALWVDAKGKYWIDVQGGDRSYFDKGNWRAASDEEADGMIAAMLDRKSADREQIARDIHARVDRNDRTIAELARYAIASGVPARLVVPDDSSSRYLYVGDGPKPVKIRAADHPQPTGPGGKPLGGVNKATGIRHDAADISIDPESSATIADAKRLIDSVEKPKIVTPSLTTPPQTSSARVEDITPAGTKEDQPTSAVVLDKIRSTPGRAARMTDSPYEGYTPQKVKIKGAKPHPTALVESAAMASVPPPDADYVPRIDPEVIKSGALSEAQLETIVYAGQATSGKLPDGRTRGFMCGDGTGLGKGRTIAGIMADSFARGAKKAVWISMRPQLRADAERDLEAIGVNDGKVVRHDAFKGREPIKGEGVLFSTYGTLRYDLNGQNPRWKQMADWLGADFDGVIVFDESHFMKNAIDTGAGQREVSATATAALALQEALPKARVHYFSATGATEVANLAYAERLGLWGEGTPFPNKAEFISQIEAGGVAAMEWVARDMKQMGLYISRQIDYAGTTQDRLTHALTEEQKATYDTTARVWRLAQDSIFAAMGITATNASGNIDPNVRRIVTSQFYSAELRFFNSLVTSMQMPSIIRDIERELKDGKSAVLQLTSTNEAALNRALGQLEEGQSIEELDLTPKRQLVEMIRAVYPTAQYEEVTDPNTGRTQMQPVKDSSGSIVQNPQAVAMREALIEQTASLEVPDGALDQLLRHFGPDAVAENTGRTRRIVQRVDPATGRSATKEESRSPRVAQAEVGDFNAGRKRILVFSAAGGTGASYHAGRDFANQQKRVHYLVQAGWTADVAVQGFGRTHRSNQAQPPHYRLVTTDLRGQSRFISTIAKRLEQLGALTRGDRNSGGSLFSAADNLESTEATDALRAFFHALHGDSVRVINLDEFQRATGLRLTTAQGALLADLPPVTQFLNRLLVLPYAQQNAVFDEFAVRLERIVAQKTIEGTLDTGMQAVKADGATVEADKLVLRHASGAETRYVKVNLKHRNRPLSFADMAGGRNPLRRTPDFLVRNKRSKHVYGVFELESTTTNASTGRVDRKAVVVGPMRHEIVPVSDVRDEERYEQIDNVEAEARWKEQIDKSPQFREETMHFITGVILPVWDRVRGRPVVRRLQTDDGQRILGRVVAEADVASTLRALGMEAEKVTVTGEELLRHVLEDGRQAVFANGWRLVRVRLAGDDALELIGPSLPHHGLLDKWGVSRQMMSYKMRYFVPTGETGPATLDRIMGTHQVMELVAVGTPGNVSGLDAATGRVIDAAAIPADTSLSAFGPGQALPPQVAAYWAGQDMRDSDLAARGDNSDAVAAPTTPRIPVAPLPGGTPKSLRQIIDDFAKAVGKRPRLGSVRKGGSLRSVLGTYFWASQRVNISRRTDLEAIAHEMAGHLIDDRFGVLAPWVGARQRSPYDRELIPAFSQHGSVSSSGPRSTLRYRRSEGLAEWVRAYIMNPQAAVAAAPTFAAHFKSVVAPATLKALEDFSADVRTFYGQSAAERTAAQVNMQLVPAQRSLVQRVAGLFSAQTVETLKAELVDDLAPYTRAVMEARLLRVDLPPLKARNDPALLARLYLGESKRIQAAIEFGVPKAFTAHELADGVEGGFAWLVEPIASGLTDPTVEQLNARMREALVYLISDRVVYKARQWLEEARRQIAALDPADANYQKKADKIMADVGHKVQNMSGAGAGAELDMKVASDAIMEIASDPDKLARAQEFSRRYQAWGRGLLKYWYDMGRISLENYVKILEHNEIYADLHRVMDDATGATAARLGKRLGAVQQVIYKFEGSTREINNPLVNLMQQTADMIHEADRNYVVDNFVELLRYDRDMHQGPTMDLDAIGSQGKKGDPNAIRVFHNGQEQYWQFRDDVYQAVKSMGQTPELGPILRGVSYAVKTLPQIGITQNPAFVLRQMIRDPFYRAIVSNTGSTVRQAWERYTPQERLELERMGGFQGGLYLYDETWDARMRREISALAKQKGTLVSSPQRAWQWWTDTTAELGDTRTRQAEYRTAKAKFIAEGDEEFDAALKAAGEARGGGAIDYAVAGKAVRSAAPFVLFLNPAIQGLRRTVGAARANPARFAARWSMYVMVPRLIAALLRYMMGDDDEYQQMPAWRRDFFLNVKVGGFWLSLPQPYELGVLGSVAERLIYAGLGRKRPFEGVAGSLVQGVSPVGELPVMSGLFKAAVENAANWQFFFDRSIVPAYEEGLDVSLRQGTSRASRIGQALQAVTGTDARYIDNLVYNTFGGTGALALSLSDIGREDKPMAGLLNTVTGMTRSTVAADSVDVQALYRMADAMGERQSQEMKTLRLMTNRYNSAKSLGDKNEAAQKIREYAGKVRDRWEREMPARLREKAAAMK